jgi:small-conductance mechanosensitive channel
MYRKYLGITLLIVFSALLWFISGYYPGLYFFEIALSLLAVAIVYIFTNIFLSDIIFKHIVDQKTRYTVNKATSILSFIIIFIILLRIWVADASSLVLSLGVIGAGVAIALQDVFKNFAGGFIIITLKPFEVGDRIEISGEAGDVIDIGVMTTALLEIGGWVHGDQPTGRVTLIPNGLVITHYVHNYTKDHSFIWDELTIPITYDSDWRQAREIMLEIVRGETAETTRLAEAEIERLGEKYYFPKKVVEPGVFITPTDNWITFHVRYVTHVKERRLVRNKLYSLIVARLQEVGEITIASGTLSVTIVPPRDDGKPDQTMSGS